MVERNELGSIVSRLASWQLFVYSGCKKSQRASPQLCWGSREILPLTKTLPLKLNSYRKHDALGVWEQLECTTKDSGKFL